MPQVIKGSVRKLLHDMIIKYKCVQSEAELIYNKKARCLDAIIEATLRLDTDIQHNITASVENLRTLEQNDMYNTESQYLERIAVLTVCETQFDKKMSCDDNPWRYHDDIWRHMITASNGFSVRSLRRIKREGMLNKGEWKTPGKRRSRKLKVSNLNEYEISMIRKKIDEFYTVKKEVPTLRKLLAELRESMGFTGCRETLRKILLNNGLTIQSCSSQQESIEQVSTKKSLEHTETDENRFVSELRFTSDPSDQEILNMETSFDPGIEVNQSELVLDCIEVPVDRV